MQRKRPMPFRSEHGPLLDDVERHFRAKAVELPPHWEALVAIAYSSERFVTEAEPPCDESNFDEWKMWAFRTCFETSPDLTLKILAYARKRSARLYGNTKSARVRRFLLAYQPMVREKDGSLRYFRTSDWDSKEPVVLAKNLQDAEIAGFLFGPKSGRIRETKKSAVNTLAELVKNVRQALSVKVEKGTTPVRPSAKRPRLAKSK